MLINSKKVKTIRFTCEKEFNESLVHKLSNNIKFVSELKLGAYKVIDDKDKSFLFKFSRSFFMHLKRNKFNTILAKSTYTKQFFNEVFVNCKLNTLKTKCFKYPKLITHYKEGLMVFEYIENTIKYNQKDSSHSELVIDALLELQSIDFGKKTNKVDSFIEGMKDRVIYFRNFVVGIYKRVSIKQIVIFYTKYRKLLKNHIVIKKTYCHGDPKVNMLISDENLYIIDFEGVRKTAYVLEDIVECSTNNKTMDFNSILFNDYLESFHEKEGIEFTIDGVQNEVRILLIRKCLRSLRAKTRVTKTEKENIYLFLNEILFVNCNSKLH